MKNLILSVTIILTLYTVSPAQSSYNQELEKAATEIARKITVSGKKSVAVLDFENSNKQVSELGGWLASVFTTHLENNSNNEFVVKNRTDIEKAIQQIKSESGSGAYDSKTIQRLGEISGSDVIVYGEITLMDNEITVNIRTKNISLNSTIGGVLVSFEATDGMRTKYDNYIEDKSSSSGSAPSQGGASGEGTARISKNPNCRQDNTGDYCFTNTTKLNLTIQLEVRNQSALTVDPGQTQCFYNLTGGAYEYSIYETRYGKGPYYVPPGVRAPYYINGQVYIEQCKSKIFNIK